MGGGVAVACNAQLLPRPQPADQLSNDDIHILTSNGSLLSIHLLTTLERKNVTTFDIQQLWIALVFTPKQRRYLIWKKTTFRQPLYLGMGIGDMLAAGT